MSIYEFSNSRMSKKLKGQLDFDFWLKRYLSLASSKLHKSHDNNVQFCPPKNQVINNESVPATSLKHFYSEVINICVDLLSKKLRGKSFFFWNKNQNGSFFGESWTNFTRCWVKLHINNISDKSHLIQNSSSAQKSRQNCRIGHNSGEICLTNAQQSFYEKRSVTIFGV